MTDAQKETSPITLVEDKDSPLVSDFVTLREKVVHPDPKPIVEGNFFDQLKNISRLHTLHEKVKGLLTPQPVSESSDVTSITEPATPPLTLPEEELPSNLVSPTVLKADKIVPEDEHEGIKEPLSEEKFKEIITKSSFMLRALKDSIKEEDTNDVQARLRHAQGYLSDAQAYLAMQLTPSQQESLAELAQTTLPHAIELAQNYLTEHAKMELITQEETQTIDLILDNCEELQMACFQDISFKLRKKNGVFEAERIGDRDSYKPPEFFFRAFPSLRGKDGLVDKEHDKMNFGDYYIVVQGTQVFLLGKIHFDFAGRKNPAALTFRLLNNQATESLIQLFSQENATHQSSLARNLLEKAFAKIERVTGRLPFENPSHLKALKKL